MSLMWHIMKKDGRRVVLPAAIWIAFVVGTALWFWQTPIDTHGNWWGWFDVMRVWALLIALTQVLFGVILAGTVGLEDPMVGSRAFWSTRPIGGGRLFGAKIGSVTALFALAPAALLTAMWLAFGFSVKEALAAAMGVMASQFAAVGFAIMVAALTRTLAQFLLVALILGAVFSMATIVVASWVLVAVTLAVGAHQFLTRKTLRSWLVFTVGLAIGVAGFGRWPTEPRPLSRVTNDARVAATVDKVFGRVGSPIPTWEQRRYRVPTLSVRTGRLAETERVFLPVRGEGELTWADGQRLDVKLRGGQLMPEAVVNAAAGAGAWPAELNWHLKVSRSSAAEATLRKGPIAWKGVVEWRELRRAFVAELPLQEGAVVQTGANQLRVLAVTLPGTEGNPAVMIEERDAWTGADQGLGFGSRIVLGLRPGSIDYFVLKTRDGVHVLSSEELGAVSLTSTVRGVLRLGLPRNLTAEQLQRAVLIKVRFEKVDEFATEVNAPAIEVVTDRES